MSNGTSSSNAESLIVVSNRLPYNVPREPGGRAPKRNVGGLVNALEPVMASRGGAWIGWDGIHLPSAGAVASSLAHPVTFRAPSGITLHGVPLSDREVGRYYHGFANRAIWPLFHGFLTTAVFQPEDYAAYVRVNRRFAESALGRAGREGRIWVHDFHLMLVPLFLREMGFRGRIDFFLHIPFPAPEIFRALPWRREILRGLLAADTVAFHTELYRDNFVSAAALLAGGRALSPDARGQVPIRHDGGRCAALAVPIGIDVEDFERVARMPAVEARAVRVREAHSGCRILFGADRLDYTKGIKERLHALEHYLKSSPEVAGTVVLIQVLVPSRHKVEEYRVMKREIDQEVGRINGEYGREGWIPIHYLYRALDREELVAYYRAADVALVTPLRDGMNLVAAEFATSRVDVDGVLIVSEFAGIADRCDGAIRVNPYDRQGTAQAIAEALAMDASERARRMTRLQRFVRSNTVSRWADCCLGVTTPREPSPPPRPRPIPVREPAAERSPAKLEP